MLLPDRRIQQARPLPRIMRLLLPAGRIMLLPDRRIPPARPLPDRRILPARSLPCIMLLPDRRILPGRRILPARLLPARRHTITAYHDHIKVSPTLHVPAIKDKKEELGVTHPARFLFLNELVG